MEEDSIKSIPLLSEYFGYRDHSIATSRSVLSGRDLKKSSRMK
jgi:hypothetical protein